MSPWPPPVGTSAQTWAGALAQPRHSTSGSCFSALTTRAAAPVPCPAPAASLSTAVAPSPQPRPAARPAFVPSDSSSPASSACSAAADEAVAVEGSRPAPPPLVAQQAPCGRRSFAPTIARRRPAAAAGCPAAAGAASSPDHRPSVDSCSSACSDAPCHTLALAPAVAPAPPCGGSSTGAAQSICASGAASPHATSSSASPTCDSVATAFVTQARSAPTHSAAPAALGRLQGASQKLASSLQGSATPLHVRLGRLDSCLLLPPVAAAAAASRKRPLESCNPQVAPQAASLNSGGASTRRAEPPPRVMEALASGAQVGEAGPVAATTFCALCDGVDHALRSPALPNHRDSSGSPVSDSCALRDAASPFASRCSSPNAAKSATLAATRPSPAVFSGEAAGALPRAGTAFAPTSPPPAAASTAPPLTAPFMAAGDYGGTCRERRSYLREEDSWILSVRAAGVPLCDVAAAVQRSERAVGERVRRLRSWFGIEAALPAAVASA